MVSKKMLIIGFIIIIIALAGAYYVIQESVPDDLEFIDPSEITELLEYLDEIEDPGILDDPFDPTIEIP